MKIKDLPENDSLLNVRFIYPSDGKKYYWKSQWQKGVWGATGKKSERRFPLYVDDLKEAMEWDVIK